ncbi:carbamoyltransferase HypF [Flavobacterium sp. KACC 22763]|uniref:carbamoyltransferase HypF n=1 Tax=Flavobacterium sp. KACC 22763 TaxID=3025668 RepID=UPI002365A2FC|nr:carbamoyltransferase HypF [Flavobacterium sp. KACC 22763]WDF62224.1 carbamoyltransferase HypF [Flavobacterium sp. KACC 22763]
MNPSFQIKISGTVQGVGFRPFVYNLAVKLKLKGYVSNAESGVIIIVQGSDKIVTEFYSEIRRKHPRNARINEIQISEISIEQKFDLFFIKPTEKNISVNSPLTPDFAICKNCKDEVLDPENHRYYYPFISCTSCGPRYAIAEKFPFERENTSMNKFKMCEVCLEEYQNPLDIRFHSQTNSCPNCGVQISFTDNKDTIISGSNKEIFEAIAEKLNEGKIIAVKNTSGYLLLCDATSSQTVQELRNRKKRLTKPFAILFPDTKQIENYLFCHKTEKNAIKSAQAPIVILPLKKQLDLAIDQIAPNMKTIGAMLPNSGILHLISNLFQKPLVATSGNFNGSSIFADQDEAIKTLNPIADYYLHHNLEIQNSQDDSVLKFSRKNKQKIFLRHARGFAPNIDFSFLQNTSEKLICLGATLKNTITITPNNQVYTSEYIGDLLNFDTYNRFEKKIKNYQHFFDFSPKTVLCDQHPNYENNKIISTFSHKDTKVETVKIQHHEAHFAAILSEKKLWKRSKILGVVWDGAGFGSQTEIFGGEFYEYDHSTITRIGHLEYFAWILGDQMAKNPKIAALSISKNSSYLHSHFNKNELKVYSKLIKENSIKTSSMGRLIDAVAFILGFTKPILFEAEAGMYLENLAQNAFNKSEIKLRDYLKDEKITHLLPTKKLLLQVAKAVQTNKDLEMIALNFHFTLVKCIEKIAAFSKLKEIAFSGGVFQNSILVDLIIDHLKPKYKLHFHETLSPNDENISFGQLNHYLHLKK